VPVEYSHPCEPYAVALVDTLPRYDERFRGRGQNKARSALCSYLASSPGSQVVIEGWQQPAASTTVDALCVRAGTEYAVHV
jgi:hypothetical protein